MLKCPLKCDEKLNHFPHVVTRISLPTFKSCLLLTYSTRKSLEHQCSNAHSNVTKNLTRASRSNTGTLLGSRENTSSDVRWRMEENVGGNMITFTGWNQESDEVMFLETITLTKNAERRVRTLQIFEDGNCVEIVTTCEKRMIDAGSGAVVPVV